MKYMYFLSRLQLLKVKIAAFFLSVWNTNNLDQNDSLQNNKRLMILQSKKFHPNTLFNFEIFRNMYDQFRKIMMHYKRIGYNLNVMWQSTC